MLEKIKFFVFPVLISVILIFGLYEQDNYKVVTNGKCYTYKTIFWTKDTCFKTKAEAYVHLNEFKEFKENRERYENSDWQPVE